MHEHFVKQSIRNRCDIYGANGKLQLTIPKQRKGSDKTIIKEIQISYKQDWQKEHWNAIVNLLITPPLILNITQMNYNLFLRTRRSYTY